MDGGLGSGLTIMWRLGFSSLSSTCLRIWGVYGELIICGRAKPERFGHKVLVFKFKVWEGGGLCFFFAN